MITHAVRCSVSALAISLAVGAIAFAPAAYAQTQSPRYGAPQEQYHAPQTRDQRDRRGDENRLDRRIMFLHQRLGITPAQETAWTAFAGELLRKRMNTQTN